MSCVLLDREPGNVPGQILRGPNARALASRSPRLPLRVLRASVWTVHAGEEQ
jgi:hypothetical protein